MFSDAMRNQVKRRGNNIRSGVLLGLMATLAACVLARSGPARAATVRTERPWLVVSDIHLDLFDSSNRPSAYAFDTNRALFVSAVVRMKRAAPNPAVVLLPGDFLMHDFAAQARRHDVKPDEAALRSMGWIAEKLERAFPRARFAIALGNNDVPCGDYKSANGSAYLAAVARIWAPLIDRGGAAPDFVSSFSLGGYYATRLSGANLRLIVLNTVPLSTEYRGNCGAGVLDNAPRQFAWLSKTLADTRPGTRNVLMMHIPPGFDAFSTDYLHALVAWRFLSARYDDALVDALDASSDHVAYAIAGHTHRFDFRVAGDVPVLVFGALSPIYANNPSFYVLRVRPNGSLRDIDVHAFDEADGRWVDFGSFDRAWGLRGVDVASLDGLRARLAKRAALRREWYRQSGAWPSDEGIDDGTWTARWRVSWCAQDLLVRDFGRCAGIRNWLVTLPLAIVLVSFIVVFLAFLVLLPKLRARIRPR